MLKHSNQERRSGAIVLDNDMKDSLCAKNAVEEGMVILHELRF